MDTTKYFFCAFILFFINSNVTFSQTDTITVSNYSQDKRTNKKDKKALKKQVDKEFMDGRKLRISTSFISASLESSITIQGSDGILGAELSLEDLLGFKKTKLIPKLDFQYAFNRHSSLYAEYYNISRSSSILAEGDFEWGDIEVGIDEVDLYLNTQIWSLGYMYYFINKPHAKISFFANIFVLGIKTGLDIDNKDIHSKFSITAPLPSFGYRFSYEILPKVRFGGTHSFFLLQIGDYGGSVSNYKLNLDYETFKWLRAGISYSKFDLNITSEAKKFKGIINYDYDGPGLYLQFIF